MPKGVLSPKERIFVQEYLVDKNGARTARAAGYPSKFLELKTW
jgi:phage terminase small subunit